MIFILTSFLFTLAFAAPITRRSSIQTSPVSYFYQNGIAGACSLFSSDQDLVVGLPLSSYPNLDSISSLCGSYISITSPIDPSLIVRARVADASGGDELAVSIATFKALNGFDQNLESVNWEFIDATPSTTPESAPSVHHSHSIAYPPHPSATPSSTSFTPPSPPPSPTTTPEPVYTPPPPPPAPSTTPPAPAPIDPSPVPAKSSSGSSGQFWGDATFFYQQGQAGACGTTHSDGDYIVALETAMYNGGSHCGQKINIYSSSGSSITATVADECPSCDSSTAIDLSVATFNALGAESQGVLKISWSWA